MSDPDSKPASVVIVDDTPANLELLASFLQSLGYQVFALPNGEMALNAVAKRRPDIILLDIVMPGLSGYDVCRRLKADPATADIPVLFLTALAEPRDKVQAFAVGGVDYITKPLQMEEVEARVRTHLELSRQRRELERSNQQLRELEHLRDNLTHMIVHDLRAPLTVVGFNLEILRHLLPSPTPELEELLATAHSHTRRLGEMIAQLLDLARLESGQMPIRPSPTDLLALARSVRQTYAPLAAKVEIDLVHSGFTDARCDSELIERVLGNLLANALKYSPESGRIEIAVDGSEESVRVSVSDQGPGVPEEWRDRIFDKFGQVDVRTRRGGFGVGLAFCRLAVETHGGRIGVRSEVNQGSRFWFLLPRTAPTPSPSSPSA